MEPVPVKLTVKFYQSAQGTEPVREWLQSEDFTLRKAVGADIKTVQIGWPLGMPLVRKIATDLWEVRSTLAHGIARVFFTVVKSEMVLLHGFIKKSQRTPASDLQIAKDRLARLKGNKP